MVQNRIVLIIHFLRAQNEKILVYGAGAAWSRLFLPGAGADPSRSEPESALGLWPPGAGAAQKSGGSATLDCCGSGSESLESISFPWIRIGINN